MYWFLLVLYIFLVLIMIGVVLIQEPKSGGLSATFGGSAQAVFGAKGAPTFFTRATWVLGGLYLLLSLVLSLMSAPTGGLTIEREVRKGELYKHLAPLIQQEPQGQQQGGEGK